jgi:hypothetical protein
VLRVAACAAEAAKRASSWIVVRGVMSVLPRPAQAPCAVRRRRAFTGRRSIRPNDVQSVEDATRARTTWMHTNARMHAKHDDVIDENGRARALWSASGRLRCPSRTAFGKTRLIAKRDRRGTCDEAQPPERAMPRKRTAQMLPIDGDGHDDADELLHRCASVVTRR